MSVSGTDVVKEASKYLGDPYVFGAEGPNTFDCSGLVEYVYRKFGIKTPRVAADQAHFGVPITRAKIQPGDLIFFNWHGGSSADHVGIYAGNGEMIHAPHTGTVVKRVKLNSYYWANNIAIRRFPGVTNGPADSTGLLGQIGDAISGIGNALNPVGEATGIAGALTGIASSAADIGRSALSVGRVADTVLKLFLPSNMMRAAAWVMGSLFILLGIFFLSREVRN